MSSLMLLSRGGSRGGVPVLCRALSAQPETAASNKSKAKAKKAVKPAVQSKSFVQNIFRGIVEPEQAFPFPKVKQLKAYLLWPVVKMSFV